MEDTAEISSNDCFSELDFLNDISSILAETTDSEVLLNNLKSVFNKYLNVNSFCIFIKDYSSSTLRDFVKNWITIEKNKQEDLASNIFNRLKNVRNEGFILNNKLIRYNLKNTNRLAQDIKNTENLIYFAIFDGNNIIGIIEINFDKNEKNISRLTKPLFLSALKISISQISNAIINKILNQKLCVYIKFQNVMKSIAKLIENQFEIAYILPIIGELIDGFVTEHLIYIFIKGEDGKMNLFWPLDCQDDRILELLPKITDKKNYIISKDGKTGLFAIRNDDQTIGIIAASSNIDKLSRLDIDYLLQLSSQASVTTRCANTYAQMLKFATLDALTGLNNRRQFEVRLKQETANARRNKKPLCCIMLDIDYFKHVNDTWGHSAGDSVLKNVAQIVTKELREYDIASRYGGEEFCILLPDTKLNEAAFVAQRLRRAVEKTDINISDDKVFGTDMLNVTISIGVSEFKEEIESPERLHQCADIALYEAKKRGRNRVVVYDSSLE